MPAHSAEESRFEGIHCLLRVQQFPGGMILLRISGSDVGEFGDAPLLDLDRRLAGGDLIDLFVDAREVRGASIAVSAEWARWLGANKSRLRRVHMLTGSRYVQVTADFVRRFADLQAIMQVYTDEKIFDTTLLAALGDVS